MHKNAVKKIQHAACRSGDLSEPATMVLFQLNSTQVY